MAKRLCRCGAITDGDLCIKCRPPAPTHSKTTSDRGYGHDWRKLSESEREKRPICEVCDARGKATPAAQQHHIEPIWLAPHRRLDPTNTLSVCTTCHAEVEGMTPTELRLYLKRLESEQ